MPHIKEHIMVLTSVVVATAILVAAYVANGSEYEDAWLYITAGWIVLMPALDLFLKRKLKPGKKKR